MLEIQRMLDSGECKTKAQAFKKMQKNHLLGSEVKRMARGFGFR